MKLRMIEMENFKCYERLNLPCSSLTVLTGYNSGGKSTAIQPLLLMAQTLRGFANERQLALNGDLVCLGTEGDVLRHGAVDPTFSLGVRSVDERIRWRFGQRARSHRGLVRISGLEYVRDGGRRRTSLAGRAPKRIWPAIGGADSPLASAIRGTTFISAARALQLEAFPVPTAPFHSEGDVGAMGEYAPYWYLECADDEVAVTRRHADDDGETVRSQVDAWLGELFPGVVVNADRLAPDAPVRLTFSLTKSSSRARPTNVGFGLSYAFPMLVALLTRPRGSIIVVESAESHLHPRGQSAVGRLLARMAGAGLQIFVETHSDHLLNGVRLAVRDGLLQPEDVALHFFGLGGRVGQVTTLALDSAGTVNDWPEGFFDQAERDLAVLSGWT